MSVSNKSAFQKIVCFSKATKVSFGFLAFLSLIAITLPFLSFLDPNSFDPNQFLNPKAPSLRHWFGTDDLNRDLLLRCLAGARISLSVGLISVGISSTIGTLYGLISGYLGGKLDEFLMRLVDLFMAIPSIFLILSIQIILTPSIFNVMIVIGLTSWMGVARLVRAEVLSVKERAFVQAAKARGLSQKALILRYIMPHTLSPVIVASTLGIGSAILTESVLSFLGLGVQPPHASWGNMLENSLSYMQDAPWMTLCPGLCITFTVLAFNFIGDGLRSVLNPRELNA